MTYTMGRAKRAVSQIGVSRRLILVLILAVGFLLRAIQTHLGLPYVYNFDDPQIAAHALGILKTGDLNPHFFAYGSFMIYLDTIVSAANYLRLAGLPVGQAESMIAVDQVGMLNSIASPADGTPVWYWTISHPSFYLWDRYVTAIFGTLTIAVTYALSRRVIPGRMAFLPPLFLAVLPIHIVQSGLTTTDVPAGFMVGAATLAAVIFAETGSTTAFSTSLICVGLAGATKYNAALAMMAPLIALALQLGRREGAVRWWHWLLLIAVPAVTFLAAMPFALLDFNKFITDLAQSVSSYHVAGPAAAKPGLRHLRLILSQFTENIGLAGSLLSIAGLAGLIGAARSRTALLIPITSPILFVIYMSMTTTDHHRNFIQIYPFICLYCGYGIYWISRFFVRLDARNRFVGAPLIVGSLLMAIVLLPLLYNSAANAVQVAGARDTRTQAVLRANTVDNIRQIEISNDLHIHAIDMNRLRRPTIELEQGKIMRDICAVTSTDSRTFILPVEIRNSYFLGGSPDQGKTLQRFNILLQALRQRPDTVFIGSDIATPSWGPPINPGIMIVQSRGGLCDGLNLDF
jgi:hypothetical protein